MGIITEFLHKNKRVPILIWAVVWVITPVLEYVEVASQHLCETGHADFTDWLRVVAHACVVGLLAIGGFMSRAYHDWHGSKTVDSDDYK